MAVKAELEDKFTNWLYSDRDFTGMELFSGSVTMDKKIVDDTIELSEDAYSGQFRQLVVENSRSCIVRVKCGVVNNSTGKMLIMQTIEKEMAVVSLPLEVVERASRFVVEHEVRCGIVLYIRRYYPQLVNEADKIELINLEQNAEIDAECLKKLFANMFLLAVLTGRASSYYKAVAVRQKKLAYYNRSKPEVSAGNDVISFTEANRAVFNFGIVMFVLFVIWFIYS